VAPRLRCDTGGTNINADVCEWAAGFTTRAWVSSRAEDSGWIWSETVLGQWAAVCSLVGAWGDAVDTRGDTDLGERAAHISSSACRGVVQATGHGRLQALLGVRAAIFIHRANCFLETDSLEHGSGHVGVSIVVWVTFVARLSITPPGTWIVVLGGFESA